MTFLIISLAAFLSLVLSQPSPFGFNIQLIGKSRFVSVREENARNFCTSIQCLSDADILFTRSSQYAASDPCLDFANFSLATAIDVGPPSDRDRERSFMRGIHNKVLDRFRRTFIDKKLEGKFVGHLRQCFRTFIRSDHPLRHINGHKEFVNYCEFLGGSPYLSRHLAWNPFMFDKSNDYGLLKPKNSSALEMDLWDEENYNFDRIIENEPEFFLKYFFDLELKRCKVPRENSTKSVEILCLDTYKYISGFTLFADVYKSSFEDPKHSYKTLESMNDFYAAGAHGKVELKEKLLEPAMKNFVTFLEARKKILNNFKESKPEVIKIKELKNYAKNLKIDWLKLINFQLFDNYQVTEDDEIQVKDLRMFKALAENLIKMPKGIIADFFFISFAYENNGVFEFHQDDELRKAWTGSKKSVQRWEIIVERFYMYLSTALQLMYDQKYGDDKIKRSAENFVAEALKEARKVFTKSSNLPLAISIKVLSKLKAAKIICGFDHRVMKNFTLDTFYEEIAQEGHTIFPNGKNRTFNYSEIKRFGRKIMTTPKDDERRLIYMQASYDWFDVTKIVEDYEYNMERENILFFPSKTLIYPFYHPDRPRFFNMATLFVRAIFQIHQGIKRYVNENFNIQDFKTGLENPVEVAYQSYRKWLQNHEDLQLGANLLTNQQLFWVARAAVEYRKLHRKLPIFMLIMGNFLNDFTFQHEFQQNLSFMEAFKCNATNERGSRNLMEKYEMLGQLRNYGFDLKDLERISEVQRFL